MAAVRPQSKSKSSKDAQEQRWGFLFISPWIIGILFFTAFPLLLSLYWSFFDYNPVSYKPKINYYSTLGIDSSATAEDIKTAYEVTLEDTKATIADKESDADTVADAKALLPVLEQSQVVLSDPAKRAAHDQNLKPPGLIPKPSTFVGLTNWINIAKDPDILQSIKVTARFVAIVVPFSVAFSLVLAMILSSSRLKFQSLWVTAFFLPQLIPFVSAGLMWKAILNKSGPINVFIEKFGVEGPGWLYQAEWMIPAIAILQTYSAGYAMLQFMTALRSVPKDLYEAAKIDGANGVQTFFNVTLPMISSIIFYNVVTGIIAGFQYFTIAYLLYDGSGGPDNNALFYSLLLYKEAIKYFNLGYAAAMAWAMLIVALLITQGLFALQRKFVYYATEEK